MTPLVLTGERTLPGIAAENYWFRRHEAAYGALLPWCRGAVVLDAGCGEGYGSALLATVAHRVVGVDLDPAASVHAGRTYGSRAGSRGDVSVVRGDLQRLPVAGGAVEVVACLQVLEHLADQAGFLRECARVLRPGGTLLLTTPNRLTFSPGGAAPVNPFHTRELSPSDLRELLAPCFAVSRLAGVRPGRRLRRVDRRHPGGLVAAQLGTPAAVWHPRLRRDVAGVRTKDFALSEVDVDTSLDLLAVATRR